MHGSLAVFTPSHKPAHYRHVHMYMLEFRRKTKGQEREPHLHHQEPVILLIQQEKNSTPEKGNHNNSQRCTTKHIHYTCQRSPYTKLNTYKSTVLTHCRSPHQREERLQRRVLLWKSDLLLDLTRPSRCASLYYYYTNRIMHACNTPVYTCNILVPRCDF